MRIRSSAIIAITAVALLTVAVAAPALAGSGTANAVGAVTWAGESGADPGRESAFRVFDGAPGENDREGDSGWYSLDKQNGASMLMDISCVRIDDGWAEFAGVIVEASAPFTVGEVFLVSVKDSGKRGTRGDEIGMKHRNGIAQGCANALDEEQFGRKGIITGGNIRIRAAR